MALPILDGNQSATTLSTIVTGGQHIPAHTVISLGSQAITDMRSAVSGSVVSISNFPATQPISGTVTAQSWFAPQGQLGTGNIISDGGGTACELGVQIGFNNASAQEFTLVDTSNPLPISGTVTANVGNSLILADAIQDQFFGSDQLINAIDGCKISTSVTIGSLPVSLSTTTIGGTARLNVTLSSATTLGAAVPSYGNLYGGSDGTNFRAINVDSSGRTVVTGTVTANLPTSGAYGGSLQGYNGTNTYLNVGIQNVGSTTLNGGNSLPVSGTVTIGNTVTVGASSVTFNSFVGQRGDGSWQAISLQTGSNYVNANIPGSITVGAMPSGALTTRFGSVTTANLATLTSAVTNTSRKYLLVQNIATSTVTIGIGFAPTTTQGIQLTAGAGLTFDAFCPTGGVWWLSSTTGSNFSILEG